MSGRDGSGLSEKYKRLKDSWVVTPSGFVIMITLVIVLFVLASQYLVPRSSSSDDMCSSCHGNDYREYCEMLPKDSASILPISFDRNRNTEISIVVEVVCKGTTGSSSYYNIDIMHVTLSSSNDNILIPIPVVEDGNHTPGEKVVFQWSVKGVSTGDALLTFDLYAYNKHGGESWRDSYSYGVSIIDRVEKPARPENLTAFPGDGYIELSWKPPADDGGAPLSIYIIYRGTDLGDESLFKSVNFDITSFRDTNIVAGETYYYYVTATNSAGESYPSLEASANYP